MEQMRRRSSGVESRQDAAASNHKKPGAVLLYSFRTTPRVRI
jgi:hypothetical protein